MVDLRWVPKWASEGRKLDSREICEDVESVAEKGVANEAVREEHLVVKFSRLFFIQHVCRPNLEKGS